MWYKAAKVLSEGISALPHGVLPFTLVGLAYGAVAALLRAKLPKHYAAYVLAPSLDREGRSCACLSSPLPSLCRYIPSTVAIALGIVLGPPVPLAMLSGALVSGSLSLLLLS
jgi:hypothetical protein